MTREGHLVITSVLPAPRTRRTSADASATTWALAARSGDPDAADRFARALHADVLRYVAYLGADPQNVDDLAQDTFVRALDSLHRFEGRASARTWLLSIARCAVADSYRRAAVRPRTADTQDWQLAVEHAQPSGLPGFDDGVALLDLLDRLPDTRREAFVLTQLLGLSYEETARLGGCPVGTVRSRVARARTTLTALLAEAELADPSAEEAAPGRRTPARATAAA
ncbi:sigma-70 family RNA polymerase sigma factor [Streptomyces sp. SID161]|uniref:sigma-70 family RNA polymerase sigma factor n=1 Tax=Streptomyces sp. SID161 TaxID=2690251 RepID=UPI00136B1CF5|nr:sigma-70 family RNA polymerase sigma factor [Streptomyces sp. SID161]MYW17268.1 sigma-70 family RNA polymerase sigma factor [Streptomyces sp. SID2955]MYW43879.1 sigma-70 family RNA polymerase sigma factor [Streptomyces sp. SID161]